MPRPWRMIRFRTPPPAAQAAAVCRVSWGGHFAQNKSNESRVPLRAVRKPELGAGGSSLFTF